MQGRHPRTCPSPQRVPRDLEIAGRKVQLATEQHQRMIQGRCAPGDDWRPTQDNLLRGDVLPQAVAKKAPVGLICDRTNSRAQFLKRDAGCRGESCEVNAVSPLQGHCAKQHSNQLRLARGTQPWLWWNSMDWPKGQGMPAAFLLQRLPAWFHPSCPQAIHHAFSTGNPRSSST